MADTVDAQVAPDKWRERLVFIMCKVAGPVGMMWGIFSFGYTLGCQICPSWQNALASSTKDILDIHTGVFVFLVGIGAILYETMSDTKKLPELVKQIKVHATDIERSTRDNAAKALALVETFVKIDTSEARRSDLHRESSSNAMAAIACNLRNWESHISSQYKAKCHFLTEVWIRAQDTYFLEEGYDIGKGEFATNGRNFCFLLLATLDALIKKGGGKKVLYSAVTPVSPKDWYNWPHGHARPKSYYEDPFIGDYQRLLREMVAMYREGNALCHRRYILCHVTKLDREAQPFGWVLDSAEEMREHLKAWIVPVSYPLKYAKKVKNSSGLDAATVKHIGALCDYFTSMIKEDSDSAFVPLFSSKWARFKEVGSPETVLAIAPNGPTISALKRLAVQYHEPQVKKLFAQTPVETLDANLRKRLDMFLAEGQACYRAAAGTKSVLDWMRASHGLEAQLAESVQWRAEAERVQKLRQTVLRYRDTIHWTSKTAGTVGEVFASQLQTAKSDCHVRTLNDEDVTALRASKIEPEFHLFGYEDADGTPQWKLAITSSLDYPFDVARISFRDNVSDVEMYALALKKIAETAKTMEAFIAATP